MAARMIFNLHQYPCMMGFLSAATALALCACAAKPAAPVMSPHAPPSKELKKQSGKAMERAEQEEDHGPTSDQGGDAAGIPAQRPGGRPVVGTPRQQVKVLREVITQSRERLFERDTTPGCTETCSLSTSICESKTQICDIAREHRDDPGFADDCAWATDACKDAEGQCHACE